ncbi:MAG: IS1634 family transposase [Bifidobacteriaceae bacterium]|nr:IS1634 family transposase [Bifidobacteriaceae bacterium]
MYARLAAGKGAGGAPVKYLQLAENRWDPAKKRSVARIVYSFGRADQVDVDAVRRLAASLTRAVGDEPASGGEVIPPDESRPAGGAWVLDHLWRRLGLDRAVASSRAAGPGRPRDLAAMERALFAMVANRALAPSSKLACAEWANNGQAVPGLAEAAGEIDEDDCYRAMDWLSDHQDAFGRAVFDSVADLLNLEVDLVFFDTTSTYWEADWADESGFRTWGNSKDHRGDLPQIVIGMAVTRDGVPVRVWCWPGNSGDQELIRQAREEMREWSLSRVVWCADRGFASSKNRRELMRGGDGYILGEKLRSGSPEVRAALGRAGRYQLVAGNLQVKEVRVEEAQDRMIVCFNPEQVPRDKAARARMVAILEDLIDGSDRLAPAKRAELKGKISARPGPNRFLRTTPKGLLRVDRAKIAAEARLDGKYLLRTSNPNLAAEDVALGCKQLLQVERGWRDMKSVLDLRPVYHHLEHRIRAHVILCWLALLLARVAENTVGDTWRNIRREMQRLARTTYTTPAGAAIAHTRTTPIQADILAKLRIPAPPRIIRAEPAPSP